MTYYEHFHLMVGETLKECQRIEHDVKLIYAGMKAGDFETNLAELKREALGTVLVDLQRLDNSTARSYFSAADYKLLREIKNIRNWLAHKAYVDFLYDKGTAWEDNFKKSYKKLKDFHGRMQTLAGQVEKVRLDILRRYGRI